MKPEHPDLLALAAAAAVGLFLSFGPHRLVWLNDGPTLDYPWPRVAAGVLAAAALGAIGWRWPGRAGRVLAFVLAGAAFGWSVHLLRYSVHAGDDALVARGLAGERQVAWKDVAGVDLEPARLVVRTAEGPLVIPTGGMKPEDRPRFERTIARRVREATAP